MVSLVVIFLIINRLTLDKVQNGYLVHHFSEGNRVDLNFLCELNGYIRKSKEER